MLPSKPWKSEALSWLLLSLFLSLALVGFGASLVDRWFSEPLMFTAGDIKDLDGFVARLMNPTNKVSQFVAGQLSRECRTTLDGYAKDRSVAPRLAALLADDLNKMLGAPGIYDAGRFAGVRLRPETERLLGAPGGRLQVRRLNRLLLEDGFPAELVQCELSEAATQARQMWLQVGFTPLFQVITFFLVGHFLRKNSMTWAEAFGLKTQRLARHILLAVGAILVVLPVCLGVLWISQRLMEWRSITPEVQTMVKALQSAKGLDQYVLLGVTAILLAPVWEEIVFRGILFSAVRQAGFPRLAWIGTSLLFAASHVNLMTFVPLFLFGAVMVWLYQRTDNLLAPVVGHALFNGLNFAWMIFVRSAG